MKDIVVGFRDMSGQPRNSARIGRVCAGLFFDVAFRDCPRRRSLIFVCLKGGAAWSKDFQWIVLYWARVGAPFPKLPSQNSSPRP